MGPGSEGHLTDEEIFKVLETGETPEHGIACAICSQVINELREKDTALKELSKNPSLQPGSDCLSDVDLAQIETGNGQEETLLLHVGACDFCGRRLRDAIEDLSRDLSPDEAEMLPKLASANPQWQRSMGRRLAGVRVRPVAWWRVVAAAASVSLTIAGGLVFRWAQSTRPEVLLARAYTETRPFVYRLRDQGYGPPRTVRSGDRSPFARSSSLLEAESRLANELKAHPQDPHWLKLRGLAELLELSPDPAVDSLTRALDEAHADSDLATDLAIAYALRAETQNRPSDYAFALDLLSKEAHKRPNDQRVLFNLALVCERLRMYEEAIRDWQRYLELDSSSPWAAEARKRLDELQRKKSARERKWQDVSEDEHAFLARVEAPENPDAYLERTALQWLARPPGNLETRAALVRLAALARERYGDAWLEDARREAENPTSADILLTAFEQNLRGDADTAISNARFAARQFHLEGRLALLRRAQVEEVHGLQRALRAGECVSAADRIASDLEHRHYRWLQVQNLLEKASCESMLGRDEEDFQILKTAKREAGQFGLRGLALRASGFLINAQTTAGDPWVAWPDTLADLEDYWQSAYPPNRAHQFYFNLALAAERLDLKVAAFALGRAAMEQLTMVNNKPVQADGDATLGAMALNAGLPEEAAALFDQSAAIAAALDPSETVQRYRVNADLARIRSDLDRGKWAEAQSRLQALPRPAGDNPEIFSIRMKRELVSGEVYLRSSNYRDSETHLEKALELARSRVQSLDTPLERSRVLDEVSQAPRLMIEALLREGRNPAEAVSLWLRFRSALTQSSELPVQDPTPPAVLAVYVVLSDRIASWMIEPSGVTFRWLAAKPSEIARQSNKLLEVASDPSSDAPSIEALGRSLYNGLMAPFGAILADNRDIAILADAGLSTIPFHLLVTPSGQFLGEQMPITVHLTFGAVRHEQPLSASDDALIAANSRVSNLLPVAQTRLADAEQEGTSVAERFRHAVLLSDTDATLTGLARYGPGAEIFHFSGHGFSNRGNGALVLADSLYTSRQIMIADWRRCRLAVLSACLTAAGELRGPSNPESLVHAFLLAGVHNVVATQWKIDSRASRSFMNAFYNSLFAGEQPAAALQTARRSLHSIPEFRHPYYWGAFQIYQ